MNSPDFSLENLHRAYLQCRKNKRRRRSALAFELNAEENLLHLQKALAARTYRPLPSVCFVTESPKPREIFAADFRDRIVHHLLVSHLEPFWERRFIHDSYACRKGKGTHAGVKRLQRFMRRATLGGSRKAYYLHMDIRSFFMSIDKRTLLDMLLRKEKNPDIRWLIEVVIFNDPTKSPIKKGNPALFDRIPAYKSLFGTPPGKGLPIGNYTSQFFANVYLNALDQFVKHTLKSPHYIRYVDDFVLVSHDLRALEDQERRIEAFLETQLKLELNPKRRKLAPVRNGCDFLGYIVRPTHLLVRRRVVNNMKSRLHRFERRLVGTWSGRKVVHYDPSTVDLLQAVLAAYLGHFSHAAAFRLKRSLFQKHRFLSNFFMVKGGRPVRTDRPPRFFRLRDQYRWFEKTYAEDLLFFQVGAFYEFYGPQAETAKSLFDLKPGPVRPRLGNRVGVPVPRVDAYWHRAVKAGLPVSLIRQTGRVSGIVMERRLACRIHRRMVTETTGG